MCGRYARFGDLETWVAPLGVDPGRVQPRQVDDDGPWYNIAPGTKGWIAALNADDELVLGRHTWAFPTSRGNRINVRSETAHVVPEYRTHFATHRCVVPASGFYEPKGPKTEKHRPWYFFQPVDRGPLYLGAIVKVEGFSILTRAPVAPVADIHDRSPIMIPAENVLTWLDPDIPGREALQHCVPEEFGGALEGWRVGDDAKRAGNEGPQLIARMA